MTNPWKPDGYSPVSPYLITRPAQEVIENEDWPAVPCHVHVYVEDANATYTRALAAGAASAEEPARRGEDPDRRGGVKDPGGNTWWIATQVAG